MIFLRNRILLVIVSLLVLGGFSHQLLASCNDRAPQKADHSGGKKSPQPSNDAPDGCQCLCHKALSDSSFIPASVPDPILVPQPAYLAIGDAALGRPPQGIDHPPQLA